MPREQLSVDEVDEIKVGDVLGWDGLATNRRMQVLEVDVTGEMSVPDSEEKEHTAGVRVRDGKSERLVSYQRIAEMYDIHRKWEDLTEEQAAKIKES